MKTAAAAAAAAAEAATAVEGGKKEVEAARRDAEAEKLRAIEEAVREAVAEERVKAGREGEGMLRVQLDELRDAMEKKQVRGCAVALLRCYAVRCALDSELV